MLSRAKIKRSEVDESEQSVTDQVGTLKLVTFGIRWYNLLHRQRTVDVCQPSRNESE